MYCVSSTPVFSPYPACDQDRYSQRSVRSCRGRPRTSLHVRPCLTKDSKVSTGSWEKSSTGGSTHGGGSWNGIMSWLSISRTTQGEMRLAGRFASVSVPDWWLTMYSTLYGWNYNSPGRALMPGGSRYSVLPSITRTFWH